MGKQNLQHRISVSRVLTEDLDQSTAERDQECHRVLLELRQELKDEGVQDFSTLTATTWAHLPENAVVIELSVDACARPEDW